VVDGIFASALNVFAYESTVTQLWQRVASTVLGPVALAWGMRSALFGLLLHLGVALAWSTVFLALATASPRLRRLIATPGGVVAVAAVYGPAIWMVMSLVVIPMLTGRAPTIGARWWVQLAGHIPFVALPIVALTAWREGAPAGVGVARPAGGAA
jgi:hypothetical protein